MSLSIWIKPLDAHFLVNCQQQNMKTDVSAIFIIREIKAAVRACVQEKLSVRPSHSGSWLTSSVDEDL